MARWLLISLWGILLLTIVDGAYLLQFSAYSENKLPLSGVEANDIPNGPVLSVALRSFDAIKEFVELHATLLTVLATIAIAYFTATLWRATSGMFKVANEQAQDMKRSLAIAKQSADAATKTVEAMQDSNSPLLFPQFQRFFIRSERNNRPTVVYRFRNIGTTPAVLNRFQDISEFQAILPPVPPFTQPLTTRPERETIIPPNESGSEIYCAFPEGVSMDNFREQFRNGRRLYIIGRVGYEDVFGRSHTKGFCVEITPAGADSIGFRIAGGKAYNGLQKD